MHRPAPESLHPWLHEILANPRIAQLLRDADQASTLLARDPSGVSSSDVREALASIYRDLGRALHVLVAERQPTQLPLDAPDPADAEVVEEATDERAGPPTGEVERSDVGLSSPLAPILASQPLYDDDWYTDEQPGSGPLFGDDDFDDEHTDVPEADALGGRTPTAEVGEVGEVVRLGILLGDADRADGALRALRPGAEAPLWKRDLDELLDLIALPAVLVDPTELPDEASKIQWASGELDHRLPRFPERVQLALLGLLAARARNVQSQLDLDIGPRMALDRLRRYRALNELPWVVGLTPRPAPETTSWAEDAEAYWLLLRPSVG